MEIDCKVYQVGGVVCDMCGLEKVYFMIELVQLVIQEIFGYEQGDLVELWIVDIIEFVFEKLYVYCEVKDVK